MMGQLGKVLLFVGLALAGVGAVLWVAAALGLRRLPGDFIWRGQGWSVIVPVGTCVAVSVVLTLLLWLWQWWQR
jgi:hypothetical protein